MAIVSKKKNGFGALVWKVELSAFLDEIGTPLKVDAPQGLGTMSINTNDYGR